MTPSIAAKDYFRSFDAAAARALAARYEDSILTGARIVETCLRAIYAQALLCDDNCAAIGFCELDETSGSGGTFYDEEFVEAEHELLKRGFVCDTDTTARTMNITWAPYPAPDEPWRFIEMLPEEVNSRAISEVCADRHGEADEDTIVQIILARVMAAAVEGPDIDLVTLSIAELAQCEATRPVVVPSRGDITVAGVIHGIKTRLEARGFTVDVDEPGTDRCEMIIGWATNEVYLRS